MKGRSGLTVLEVFIALIIMSTAIVILNKSWSGAFKAYRKSQDLNVIASLMKRKMTEVELEFRDEPLESIPETKNGDFGSEYPNFTWRLETRDLEFPDLSSLMVAQGQGDEISLMVVKQLTEHFNKSIKELKVVIIWKKGKNTVEYPIVTYITRFENGLPQIGGL